MAGPRVDRTRVKRWKGSAYALKRKVCSFCTDKVDVIDYKDAEKLRRYISDRARIEPRRRSGTCAKHQRLLATAIKRARFLALLPYVPAHIRKVGGVTITSSQRKYSAEEDLSTKENS